MSVPMDTQARFAWTSLNTQMRIFYFEKANRDFASLPELMRELLGETAERHNASLDKVTAKMVRDSATERMNEEGWELKA